MSATTNDIFYKIGADGEQFHREMKKVGTSAESNFDKVGRAAKYGIGALAAAGAGAIVGLAALASEALKTNDALAKTADSLGITTEALAGMRYAAEITGVSQEKLDKSLQVLTKNVSEAALGIGEARLALTGLGVDAQSLAKLSPDQQFSKIANAMGDVSNSGDRVRIAMKLFGEEGAGLINTLKLGESGLAKMAQEAEVLGISISRVDAAKMEAANDAMTRAGGVVKGLGNEVAGKVAPLIAGVANSFTDWALGVGGFEKAVDKGFRYAVKATGFLLDAFYPIELTFNVLKLGALAVGSFIVQGMANSGDAVSTFLNGYLTPMRVTLVSLIQVIARGAQELADFGLVQQSSATKMQEMADSWSNSINSTLTFDKSKLQGLADGMAAAVDEQAAKLSELINGPSRSQQLEAWVASAEAANLKVAEATAAGALSGTQAIAAEMVKRSELENWQYQQTLLKDIEFFNSMWLPASDLKNEIMLARASLHEKNLTDVQKAETQKRIDDAKREAQQRQQALSGMMGNLQSLMNSGNKRMFEVGKKAAIAQTVMSTIQGAQDSFTALAKIPIVGPALGAAAAAAAIVAGMGRVNQIKSQQFGGGGSVSNVAGSGFSVGSGLSASTPALAAAPTPVPDNGVGQGQQVQIVINGNVSGNDARKLVAEIAEVINTDDLVLINPNSRNGQELAALNA